MIVCICNNISDRLIQQDIQDGLDIEQIVEKYECVQCRKCNIHINELWNGGKDEQRIQFATTQQVIC